MKQIRMIIGISGNGFALSPSEVVQVGDKVDAATAAQWCKSGVAEPVTTPARKRVSTTGGV